MAVSGTVPARGRESLAAPVIARRLRRVTAAVGLLAAAFLLLRFGSTWVPAGMDTEPGAPPGSWCLVDRWSRGLRVGSDVFVATPHGVVLSRVAAVDADTVTVLHPNSGSAWPDSRQFGPVSRDHVVSTVMVVFPPKPEEQARGR